MILTDPGTEPIAVDVRTAAKMLGLGRSSVLGLADRGELTRLQFGRSVRYSTQELQALVERRRAAAQQAGIFRLTPGDPAELAAQAVGGHR